MPKLPRLTAREAEKLIIDAGFIQLRSKGSHRIYRREDVRVVIPFHAGKILHPKVIQQVIEAIVRVGGLRLYSCGFNRQGDLFQDLMTNPDSSVSAPNPSLKIPFIL